MNALTHLQIRNPKDDETSFESTTQIFSSLLPSYFPLWKRLVSQPPVFSFEIFLLNQTIYFYVTTQPKNEAFVQSLIISSYPTIAIKKTTDPFDIIFKSPQFSLGELVLAKNYYLPTKTYADFKNIDPLTSIIGFLSKRQQNEKIAIQILVTPASFAWSSHAIASTKITSQDPTTHTVKESMNPQKSLMMQKIAYQGGKTIIRIMTAANDKSTTQTLLHNLAGTYGAFSLGEGNQFSLRKPLLTKKIFLQRIKKRETTYFERRYQILNALELSTIWHPPGKLLSGIKNIAWGKTLAGEPPENLPVAKNMSDDEKKDVNFFATAEYKSENQIFGIRSADRRKHVYVVGKTGAGKSTLIANMAIDDIRKDRGVGVVDPHGDLSEIILDYIPNRRIQDVIYLEPFDTDRPFHLNVLESVNNQNKDLIASGIVSIFNKLYKDSWGPRLEYILRNVIITLLEIPGSTLPDVLPLISQPLYRKKVVEQIKDPVIKNFWLGEFDKMSDKLRTDSISPIQNKVGQFVSSSMIRNIIGHSKSTINLREIMDNKKILIMNLSQGKLGEDNASLLGAMIINQIQLTAMARAFIKEEDRVDFFLYVDEFQNFATSSFVKILSEARKYRLSLTLANQYIEQLDELIQHAVFGNIGTLISFVVGSRDAAILSKEFASLYTEADMVSMGKFETVMKLSIDNMTSRPFPAKTLPLPSLKNNNREKVSRLSKEKYGRKTEDEPIHAVSIPFPEELTSPQGQQQNQQNKPRYNNPEPRSQPVKHYVVTDPKKNPSHVQPQPQNAPKPRYEVHNATPHSQIHHEARPAPQPKPDLHTHQSAKPGENLIKK